MKYIAILGHGVVGSGVAEIFHQNGELIGKRVKEAVEIKRILDLRDFPDSPYADRFTKDVQDIIQDSDISVAVEVMGGIHPAYDFVRDCLLAGKSVVTSNKALVAAKGAELLKIAQEKNVNFLFEASVGGGIPIIRPMNQCLAANEILQISGILNGTTNFIMAKMIDDHMEFADALKLAQQLGYAERDPSADVEGDDACRKICILASLAWGKHVYPEQVATEGITKITLEDVAYAQAYGGVIKLIGQATKLENGHITAMVRPMLLKNACQLSTIHDVFNGILVHCNYADDILFYGQGAGKLPTASAVVADVMDCVKHEHARKYVEWEDCNDPGYVEDHLTQPAQLYVRTLGAAREDIAHLLGNVTYLEREDTLADEKAFLTEVQPEVTLQAQIDKLAQLPGVTVANTILVGTIA